MKHFKTWTNSESHLPTSQKLFKCYKVYKYSPKIKCIIGNLMYVVNYCNLLKNFTVTGRLTMAWNYSSVFSVHLWFKLSSYLAIRFRALFQDQSKGNSCGSTVTTKLASRLEIMVSECKKQACNPAIKANCSHHIYSILPRPACMESWLSLFILFLFKSILAVYSFLTLQTLKDYLKIWDYIPFNAGQIKW